MVAKSVSSVQESASEHPSTPDFRGSEYKLKPDQLAELHDPKSLAAFGHLFDDDPANLFKFLKTDRNAGLTIADEDITQTERYQLYGDNRIPQRKPKSFLQLAWIAFQDRIMILLTVAAVVSFALGLYEVLGQPPEHDAEGKKITKVDWVEGVAIMIAVLVVILVGSANDYQKELQFSKLNDKKNDREVIVLRNGDEHLISIHDILVGDILSLQTGDVVPADCILVKGSCECDESALTGESATIKKAAIDVSYEKYKQLSATDAAIDIGTPGAEKVPDPMLISGSKLLSGLGRAVVTSVGVNSMHGRTLMALKVEAETTPLQERLDSLANSISVYGSAAALLLFFILFMRFLANLKKGGELHDLTPAQKGSRFMNIFIVGITVIVVAVPEGLPLAVTLALAFATTRMAKDGNLVRVLRACETMGSATAVCSDKTGTLTENRMTVVKGFLGSTFFDEAESVGPSDSETDVDLAIANECSEELKKDVLTNITLNSTAFENKENEEDKVSNENPFHKPRKSLFPWSRNNKSKKPATAKELVENAAADQPKEPFLGSKTETALLAFAQKNLGMQNLHHYRDEPECLGIEKIVQIIPFESSRKWGGIVVKYKNGLHRFYIKGAAELLLRRCMQKRASDSKLTLISQKDFDEESQTITNLAAEALRAISLAHRDYPNCPNWPPSELQDEVDPEAASPDLLFGDEVSRSDSVSEPAQELVSPMVLDGIVGIQDPLRKGVRKSVEQCQKAGVTVRMVTGDNILTATAIAKKCSILSEEQAENPESSMEGPRFRKLSNKERVRILPNLRVLARSSPEDKRILVETLKKMGDVVAVTGDGTNDAPALKLADVGFSMGIAGTEVAREASDIILMTDDFSAIVNAIKWGRCVSTSIKKFIQFQLTVNVTAVVLTFVSAVASSEEASVLTAVQLLWVNLIMDTLAALALATDKPDENILERKPKGREAVLITVSTWKMILGQSTLQLIVTFILHFAGKQIFFPGKATITGHEQQQLNAMTFNAFVWLQFFKLIVTRKLDEADGISNVKDRITASNLNFFQDLFRNYYFLAIIVLIGGFQVLIMYVGGAAFSIAKQTGAMWATAIICGLLSLPVGVLIRIIPDEWVLKVFPVRAVKMILYVVGFKFLRKSSNREEDEESLLHDDSDTKLVGSTAFERAKGEMVTHKVQAEPDSSKLNPFNAYKRWRRSNSSAGSDLEESRSFIASVTMVPTLVGGAVGGFSHINANNGTSAGKNT